MSGATYTQQFTWNDFIALPDDDRRELIDGELIEVDVPTDLHEHIVAALAYFLYGWSRLRRAATFGSGYKVRVSETRGVMPDLQIYLSTNRADRREQGVFAGHPDLVVEIISESSGRYDRMTKLRWYASIGVGEYWIVDPKLRTLERLTLQESGHYLLADSLGDDTTFRPESFPGLEIPLAELWTIPQPDEG